jgi:hypothetical protein
LTREKAEEALATLLAEAPECDRVLYLVELELQQSDN